MLDLWRKSDSLVFSQKCEIDPDTFAETLGQIYCDPSYQNHSEVDAASIEQIPDIELDELKAAIRIFTNNNSAVEDGVVVELLKVAPDELLMLLLEQYNSVLANLKPDPKWL